MKIALLTILMMTSVSGLALAADKIADKTDVNSGTFAVEKMICNKSYVPATGNQSPNYQAGMDVNGQPVAPADLNAVANMEPDFVEVPMTIDLAKRMGLSQVGAEAEMPVANLKLYKNGKVEYNGQDISSNAATLCGVTLKNDEKSNTNPSLTNMIEPAAGQDQMLAAPSETINPSVPRYQSDTTAPSVIEPAAGSVAASSTSFEPKVEYKLQRQTVNKVAVPIQME